jgi:hypothetical protein
MQTLTKPKGSPVLLDRIERLASCAGHWLLIWDGEPERDCFHQWHPSPDEHLAVCFEHKWRGVSLGFVPSYCGYSDYSDMGLVGKANFNCLIDPQSTPDPLGGVQSIGYGYNGQGIVLDILRVSLDVIETIEGLEAYPLISDDEHSSLEHDAVAELWGENISDRVRTLQDLNLCIFAARRDSAPYEMQTLWDSLVETANAYPS